MDKRYHDIRLSIKAQAPAFLEYLKQFVLDDLSFRLLLDISSKTDVYVFSGVIRNYLLGEVASRDVDFVVRNLSSVEISKDLLYQYQIEKNSYGGFKAKISDLVIDIWDIENTWTLLQNHNLKPTPHTLVKTAFFNFSAIVYNVKRKSFVFGNDFLDFYMYRKIDVVNELNPNDSLCVVNTIYYAIKLGSPVKYNLCKWVINHYDSSVDYTESQLKHFHQVLFSNEQVRDFVRACSFALANLKRNPKDVALCIGSVNG